MKGKQVKALYLRIKRAICPKSGMPSTSLDTNDDACLEFYVREILVTESFYMDLLHKHMDRVKALHVVRACTQAARAIVAKKPKTTSVCNHTIVRHAIAKVCAENGYEFNYKPIKPGKKEAWLYQ